MRDAAAFQGVSDGGAVEHWNRPWMVESVPRTQYRVQNPEKKGPLTLQSAGLEKTCEQAYFFLPLNSPWQEPQGAMLRIGAPIVTIAGAVIAGSTLCEGTRGK